MIGRSAAKAVLFPPAQGTRIARRGYVFRYVLTGVFVVAAAIIGAAYPAACGHPAAVLPERGSCFSGGQRVHRKEAGR